MKNSKISRRTFLKGVGAAAATGAIASCDPIEVQESSVAPTPQIPMSMKYSEVPVAPSIPPEPGMLRFFTPHEARTVEAFTARLLPGTPQDPGARQAGVVTYIDHMLAYNQGFNEATYHEPPFVQVYDPETGIPPNADQFNNIWVPADQIERYGYQSILTPADVYRMGIPALDRYSRSQYQKNFVELSEQEQDSVIQDLLDNKADTFDQFTGKSFFIVLRIHTGEGMFSDPLYGGNRDFAGWLLIGYPGAQRAWTPPEIQLEGHRRPPQSLAQMSHFAAGEDAGQHVALPVVGSDEEDNGFSHNH